jgi:hypothetical protein
MKTNANTCTHPGQRLGDCGIGLEQPNESSHSAARLLVVADRAGQRRRSVRNERFLHSVEQVALGRAVLLSGARTRRRGMDGEHQTRFNESQKDES